VKCAFRVFEREGILYNKYSSLKLMEAELAVEAEADMMTLEEAEVHVK